MASQPEKMYLIFNDTDVSRTAANVLDSLDTLGEAYIAIKEHKDSAIIVEVKWDEKQQGFDETGNIFNQ